MLSKMATMSVSTSTPRCIRLCTIGKKSYYSKTTSWQKAISNGRIVTLKIKNDYSVADAYIYTTPDAASTIVSDCCSENIIDLDDYDGDIETQTAPDKCTLSVNNIELDVNKLTESGMFTREEAKEIYRTALKWDIVIRDKSSDSESCSDSDCDTKKLQKHAWKFCNEKNVIIGNFAIHSS